MNYFQKIAILKKKKGMAVHDSFSTKSFLKFKVFVENTGLIVKSIKKR